MFVSFFPSPRPFFTSAALWTLFVVLFWFLAAKDLGYLVWLENPPADAPPVIGISVFWTKPFLWFYLYYALSVGIFAGVWRVLSPQPWFAWSVLGSALIVFVVYFQVQVSVAINGWYGPFWDLVQAAVSKARPVTLSEFYVQILTFFSIASVAVTVIALNNFFVSHYLFRWRTAMNDFYTANWPRLRHIEGASQRVQEDSKRFAALSETLGVNFIDAVMTLIAFLPLLHRLSANVSEVPVLGAIPYPLVTAALLWSVFGTALVALVGVRLPGLEFRNQRVEAAYRKELVYGEDDANRAQPPALSELFHAVRVNYFRLYFNYLYFNVGRYLYIQTDNIFPFIVLAPTIVAGKITLGPLNQILSAFGQVRDSLQFLLKSWPTMIELMSVYKRLRAFEATLVGGSLPELDQQFLKNRQLA
ncbi:peptide antibiotic transporter SbmA [Aestuariivirga sp.]|uniref:peptide antibiotic transporter SbmA n=1 Tax=Aestuariivirga sp. TaxID=2650926 RepID=UPI00391D2654